MTQYIFISIQWKWEQCLLNQCWLINHRITVCLLILHRNVCMNLFVYRTYFIKFCLINFPHFPHRHVCRKLPRLPRNICLVLELSSKTNLIYLWAGCCCHLEAIESPLWKRERKSKKTVCSRSRMETHICTSALMTESYR